jgi:hypothetical protein
LDDIADGSDGLVVEGPVFICFLESNDGGVKCLVEREGGTKFGLGGGVERVDVMGEEGDVSLVKGGEWEVCIAMVVGGGEGWKCGGVEGGGAWWVLV